LRNPLWWKEKDNALLKWTRHLNNTHLQITKIKMQALLLLVFLDRSIRSPKTGISGVVRSLRTP
jgi:hypothetical protein